MTTHGVADERRWVIDPEGLHRLVQLLIDEFDQVLGPVVESQVIRLRPIRSDADLPVGVVDEQEAGTYRTSEVGSPHRFSYGPGPDSLKAVVHPPTSPVWTMRSADGRLLVDAATPPRACTAVIGARACDLRALGILERTQTAGAHPDQAFAARRDGLFLVAVDCTHPAPTCFCHPDAGGPASTDGFDIALTEIMMPEEHHVRYVARVGSQAGADLLAQLTPTTASESHERQAADVMDHALGSFVREMPLDEAERAVADAGHPHWQAVADRCLTCGNCTAVCPTCFCTDMHDEVSLDGATATRDRVWDSCFSMEYSSLGGAPHRASPASRYRQWLTHKLGTWHEQFGESGCVGCGRCITWCPVGIDLTAEVEVLGRPAEASA